MKKPDVSRLYDLMVRAALDTPEAMRIFVAELVDASPDLLWYVGECEAQIVRLESMLTEQRTNANRLETLLDLAESLRDQLDDVLEQT